MAIRDPLALVIGAQEPESYPEAWKLLRDQVQDASDFRSPLQLIQEAVGGEDRYIHGWRVTLASMMTMRTTRKQSHPAVWRILADYPTPEALARGQRYGDVRRRLKVICTPCSFQSGMIVTFLINMSCNWMMGIRPPDTEGAGPYVTEAYRMFHLNDTSYPKCGDKELEAYFQWQLRQRVIDRTR